MMILDDYLRDMPLEKQVEALKSNLLYAEKERDELREQVARLEAHLDSCQRRLKTAMTLWSAWEGAAASRWREAEHLRATLEKYGHHVIDCATGWDGECDCGLTEALGSKP